MKVRLKLWVKIILSVILIIAALLIYGFFINNHGYKVKEIAIYDNIPSEYNGLKIVHISDINYGNTVKNKQLKKIINNINLIKPDIIVFTGDLIYKDSKTNTDELTKLLSKMDYNIGAYYITGDEDIDTTASDILNNSGFINLDDTYNLIYQSTNPILIAGISTSEIDTNINDKLKSTLEYKNNNPTYSILLMHEPNNINDINYENFNLILAGHTHGGYIKIPILGGLVLGDNYSYGKDYYIKENTNIYISNGLGNSKFKYRLFNKPSFNFYRLRKNNS